jgi:predicted metal-dependent peptidase
VSDRPAERETAKPINAYKLAVARMWAVARQPYLASALFAMPVVSSPGLSDGTGVDQEWRLYLDPDKVEKWSPEQLGSMLIHHAGHLLRDHAGRARQAGVSQSSSERWSLAADAEINDDLVGAGLHPPHDPVLPQAMGWQTGRLAEEYFHAGGGTSDEHHDHRDTPDCGSGSDGQARPWELISDAASGIPQGLPSGERFLLRCQVARNVLEYARQGRARLPSQWRRWAEDLLEPKVDWRRALAGLLRRRVASVTGAADYTYRWPSRRASAARDVILPAMARPIPEVAVVCDTSGSMAAAQLGQAVVEVEALLRAIGVGRSRVRVLAVDAAVHTVRRVSQAAQVELVGGGGTDMSAGIAAAARLRPRPSILVVLTDGLTPWPPAAPKGMEVVVGLLGDQAGSGRWMTPEWAQVVRIPEHAA